MRHHRLFVFLVLLAIGVPLTASAQGAPDEDTPSEDARPKRPVGLAPT